MWVIRKSQSLWVRDRFLIGIIPLYSLTERSQSLWVRDRFLIVVFEKVYTDILFAIPLGQGQVFNVVNHHILIIYIVAIPLGQGQVFNLVKLIMKSV